MITDAAVRVKYLVTLYLNKYTYQTTGDEFLDLFCFYQYILIDVSSHMGN